MNIFYQEDLSLNYLNEEESRHCTKVLRLSPGAVIFLIDGKGTFCEAIIGEANPKKCVYEIINRYQNYGQKNYSLTIAIAPTKNTDRYEWFLEKATEIGIDKIVPVICRYSERKDIKSDRLNKVIISAVKQSQKAYLPELSPVIPFRKFISIPFEGKKFIAHCYEGEKKQLLKNVAVPDTDTLILIGPEGDFSKEEVEEAILQGFFPVSLGESRLRTETAALVSCHTIELINEKG
jgi:16S rRNA (uracil1498-N3)-methyltransferase